MCFALGHPGSKFDGYDDRFMVLIVGDEPFEEISSILERILQIAAKRD